MLFSNMTYIGIDPTAGVKPFTYAAMDHNRHLLALSAGNIDDVLAFAAGQEKAIAAICAPRMPNQGLMAAPEVRESLNPQPQPGRWINFRVADYQLRQHNIRIPQTKSNIKDCPNWMQMGFTLYNRLLEVGYQVYPQKTADRQTVEVYPHASFTALLGVLPFDKHTLEGRLQRQLVLLDKDVNVPDPMRYFEEITRYRLLNSILPTENLFTPEELDALVAAYSAWLAATRPEDISLFGEPSEGQVILPVKNLKIKY